MRGLDRAYTCLLSPIFFSSSFRLISRKFEPTWSGLQHASFGVSFDEIIGETIKLVLMRAYQKNRKVAKATTHIWLKAIHVRKLPVSFSMIFTKVCVILLNRLRILHTLHICTSPNVIRDGLVN